MTKNSWPIPKFYFSVKFESIEQPVAFMEVSGLDEASQIIQYRASNNSNFSAVDIPGVVKSGNVSIKKGIFKRNDQIWVWYNSMIKNTLKKETVIITLKDDQGNPVMTWTLANAYPTKISIPDQDNTNHNVQVETIELQHQGITLQQ